MVKQVTLVISLLISSLLTGCSGIKSYPNNLDKNLHIATKTDSGSFFSSVDASVDIYRVNPDCTLFYQGTVKLDKASIPVGIPPNKLSYLVFGFASSSFLGSTKGNISYDTLLKPRKGYKYKISVSYLDDIYNVAIREKHPRKSRARVIDPIGLDACK